MFGVLTLMIAAGIGGYAVTVALVDDAEARSEPAIIAPTGPDTTSTDPDVDVLGDIGVRQSDVDTDWSVVLIPDGTDHVNGTTLDLCDGTYPSERLRTARLQVAETGRDARIALSTEAVLYRNPAAVDQAFAELRRERAACTTERYLPPPDGDWAEAAGVTRLAYEFEHSDESGAPAIGASVYLRRGRVLLGVYFPDARNELPPVDGRTTVRGIVELMQDRLAALPDSVVGRGG